MSIFHSPILHWKLQSVCVCACMWVYCILLWNLTIGDNMPGLLNEQFSNTSRCQLEATAQTEVLHIVRAIRFHIEIIQQHES